MKRLYLVEGALLAFTAGYSQTARQIGAPVKDTPNPGDDIRTPTIQDEAKGDGEDLIIYWSEDFSNGLAGEGDNGAWTTGGTQGDLWFHSLPEGVEGGYDSELALPEELQDIYGEQIPMP